MANELLFDIPLSEILPLIKCKAEAETVVTLRIQLLKLKHFVHASLASKEHYAALCGLSETATTIRNSASLSNEKSSRLAAIECTLSAAMSLVEEKRKPEIVVTMAHFLQDLFHVERSLNQYAQQNKSLSQELNYAGHSFLANEKLKLCNVEKSLCSKLKVLLDLSAPGTSHDWSLLLDILEKRIPLLNQKRRNEEPFITKSKRSKQVVARERDKNPLQYALQDEKHMNPQENACEAISLDNVPFDQRNSSSQGENFGIAETDIDSSSSTLNAQTPHKHSSQDQKNTNSLSWTSTPSPEIKLSSICSTSNFAQIQFRDDTAISWKVEKNGKQNGIVGSSVGDFASGRTRTV